MRSMLPLGFAILLALPLFVRSAEPPHYTFSPQPPGTITQSVLLYMAGQAMHSQWRAVASKVMVGRNSGTPAYQRYLSIYAIDGESTYKLQYRTPGSGNFLSRVTRINGSPWLPDQMLKIDGVGQFVQPTVDNLVVEQKEASGDCGGGQVAVFTYNWTTQKVGTSIQVSNGCELHAKIIHDRFGYAIQLNGPYYGPNAPMCCPTKNNATAILRYVRGNWTMKPNYFTISASLGAHGT